MLTISFVCQAGDIEPKAVLLAASLRRWFPMECELVAAFPPAHGSLHEITIRALQSLDAQIIEISNPLRDDYPIGQKLAALAKAAGSQTAVFLDSDVLALRRPDEWPGGLAAVPATNNHFDEELWRRAYKAFELDLPPDAPPALRTGTRTAPYFNGGMITLPGKLARKFADSWTGTARKFDSMGLPFGRFLDQLALPVAARRLGMDVEALDPKWNFPAWLWRLDGVRNPILFHYQTVERLREEPAAMAAVAVATERSSEAKTALRHFGWLQ